MKISVLGTGRMGKGIVMTLAKTHHNVLWGSRNPEKAKELISEYYLGNVDASTYNDALQADIIIHTLWFHDLLAWAKEYEMKLKGKILVDIVNPFNEDFSDFTLDWGQSAAEELQKVIPNTTVVGAFKNTFFQVFDQPVHNQIVSDVYVTSDNEEAKEKVMRLLEPTSFRILDGGKLINNRTIERMTLFERELAIRYGSYPYVSFHLFGLDETSTYFTK